MATRSNIIIKKQDVEVVLYRHWDGYEVGTGFDLYHRIVKLQESKKNSIESFLLELWKENEESGDNGLECYRLTNCIHGDIEHLYIIDLSDCNNLIIKHAKSRYVENSESLNKSSKFSSYSVQEWGSFVCDERACQFLLWEERKRKKLSEFKKMKSA